MDWRFGSDAAHSMSRIPPACRFVFADGSMTSRVNRLLRSIATTLAPDDPLRLRLSRVLPASGDCAVIRSRCSRSASLYSSIQVAKLGRLELDAGVAVSGSQRRATLM